MIHKVLHTWIELQVPGLHSSKNGYVCVAPKTSFSCPPGSLQDPISPCFSSEDPTFSLKSQIFRNFKLIKSPKPKYRGNIQFGNLKLGQNQFTRLYFVQIFSSEGSQIQQWSVYIQAPVLCNSDCSTILPKWKLSATPGVSRLQELILAHVHVFANLSKCTVKLLIQKWKKGSHWVWTGEKRGSLGVRLK